MSLKQNDIFFESQKEAQEERDYFNRLLKESLAISRAKRWRAEGLRKIAFICWLRGFINIIQYQRICERNSLKPIWRLV